MSRKLSANTFGWIKDTSQFNKDFLNNYNKQFYKGYFLKNNMNFFVI